MSRVIFVVVMIMFFLFQGSVCPAAGPSEKGLALGILSEIFGEEEKAGTLEVDSKPEGAAVFVDNVLRGKTPCTLDGIAPGAITVLVELEGYVPQDKELEIQPGETRAMKFKLERAGVEAATAVAFSADPASPSLKGAAVTFKAKGAGGTGKYQYRFFKKGPATGEKWERVQAYSPKSTWIWKPTAEDVGSNQIAVHVKSAGSKAEREALKVMPYWVNAVAPATGVELSADPASPSLKGAAVTFKAKGAGGTGKYEYRFLKKGPATGEKWVRIRDYSPEGTWTWEPTAEDVGSNRIAVLVRSVGSKAKREAHTGMSYEVHAAPIEALLNELEQKIEDADKRKVAHPSFLDELRGVVKRYKEQIRSK